MFSCSVKRGKDHWTPPSAAEVRVVPCVLGQRVTGKARLPPREQQLWVRGARLAYVPHFLPGGLSRVGERVVLEGGGARSPGASRE